MGSNLGNGMNLFISFAVLPEGHARQVRGRPRDGDLPGLQPEDQPQEDEEDGEGVHDHEDQRKGGRN